MKIFCNQTEMSFWFSEMSPNTDVLFSETSFVTFPDLGEKPHCPKSYSKGAGQGEGEREREISSPSFPITRSPPSP